MWQKLYKIACDPQNNSEKIWMKKHELREARHDVEGSVVNKQYTDSR